MDREQRKKMPERLLTRDSLQEQDETVTMINQAICQEQLARLCANNVLLPTLRACSRLRDHQLDAFRSVGWCSLGQQRGSHRQLASELLQFINLHWHYRNQLLSATAFLSSSGYTYFRKFNLDAFLSPFRCSPSLSANIYPI